MPSSKKGWQYVVSTTSVFDEGAVEKVLDRQREKELTAFFAQKEKLCRNQGTYIQSLPTYVKVLAIGRVNSVNPLVGA